MLRKELSVNSHQHEELIDVTSEITNLIQKEDVSSGFCIIFVPHTTAAVTINEGADPDVKHDILKRLSTLVPKDGGYHHEEGNSDAHIKSSLLGSSEYIVIENNRLLLGTWQHVFFFEGDGPRTRKMNISLFKEK
jgi:secondary thiamine-phosphate synthase enzyme